MPTQDILEWLSDQGMTEVYTSAAVDNPSTGPGAILFQHTPANPILALRFTFVNDSTNSVIYLIKLDDEDMQRPVAHPNLTEPTSFVLAVDAGVTLLVGIETDANANGTSRVVVEYIDTS